MGETKDVKRETWGSHSAAPFRRHHRELQVWQDGMALVKLIYQATQGLPTDERFGLTAQMRRAAISVPCNVAEGAARSSGREFAHFLTMARGSLAELETQIIIARDLGFLHSDNNLDESLERVFAKLANLIKRVKARHE